MRGRLGDWRHRVRRSLDPHARIAYSQEGEDLILARFFEHQARGFFVDVGAHHPSRFSNTRLLYDRGWSGVNIDALPGSMAEFNRRRPRDVNLEIGIGRAAGAMKYFQFAEPALSTFHEGTALLRQQAGCRLQQVVRIDVLPLRDVLDRHVQPGQRIDLLNIDVEGLDLDVLESADWAKHRPAVVCVEILAAAGGSSETSAFLEGHGYRQFASTGNSYLFSEA